MVIVSLNVTNTEGTLLFDEDFNMSNFNMNFQLDPDDWVSEAGFLNIQPTKRTATLFWYSHPDDLCASITDLDLHDFGGPGDTLLEAFRRYDLSGLYHAAERFTAKAVNDHIEERERIWKEYKERA